MTFDLFGHMKDNAPSRVKDIYAMEIDNEAKEYVIVEDENLEDENLLNESLLNDNDNENDSKPEIFDEVPQETLPNYQELIIG